MKLHNRISVGVLAYLIEKDTSQDHVLLLREDFVMQKLLLMRGSGLAPYISDEAYDWLIDEFHKAEPSSPTDKKVTHQPERKEGQ